ncbi:hypothetical protein PP175_18140 [Aneurinibacillus sp. Ricciae_BoGa-3]|uniref:hypothetical protein n=1 Tax=Aneurinibacillus sp. Ricciae_BoGa-3 TaxID=3022697 RepID=UPI002341CBCA|nr:hypothetical protein [Aneurinibacillus sp. Ricciae_BoGa-3]WCK53301.1 hypothetical protein PP175_18140 [Aneurinibacillus sp. Ricciae_BoGa-3]
MQNVLYDTRQNLTGIWRADDGGIYYIRQAGDEIWWAALSPTGPANAFMDISVLNSEDFQAAELIFPGWNHGIWGSCYKCCEPLTIG